MPVSPGYFPGVLPYNGFREKKFDEQASMFKMAIPFPGCAAQTAIVGSVRLIILYYFACTNRSSRYGANPGSFTLYR